MIKQNYKKGVCFDSSVRTLLIMNEVELTDYLTKLNFTNLEAQIYLALLDSGGSLSGYQLAKKVNISRSSIYNALDHMFEKGMVMLIPDSTATYIAEKPEILFARLNYQYEENAKKAIEGLTKLFETKHEERLSNFKGFDTAIFKTKELLESAESEVYLNTDFDLTYFNDEFKKLQKKGIRVVVFSFYKIDIENIHAEVYTHSRIPIKSKAPSRLMIVVDSKVALTADTYKERDTWFGTVTNNSLMISIISEHIHNDIYLLNLKEHHGPLFNEKILLHTKFENKGN